MKVLLMHAREVGSPVNPSVLGYDYARGKAVVLFAEDKPTSKGASNFRAVPLKNPRAGKIPL